MKKLLAFGLLASVLATGCRKIVVDDTSTGGGGTTPTTGKDIVLGEGKNGDELVAGVAKITKDLTLTAGNTYFLKGLIYVTNGATLTIEPGTTIKGQFTDPIGGLVITRGSKINAAGTASNPIVFTSASPVPKSGDWAGIILLGRAKTNASYNGTAGIGEIEGGVSRAVTDSLGIYGGTNDADNSGVLQYVRIEYAGFAFLPDKEINSLTMGGVGRGTTIDHVQVTYAKDDAYEWFGGSVDCKYLISYKTQDDDFDTDNGFSGRVQFGLVVRDSLIADQSSSEAFESDNDANGSTLLPKTSAVFSNITAIGPRAELVNKGSTYYLAGAQIRRNSSISIFNSAIIGWPIGLLIDASKGTATDMNITDSTLRVRNTVIAGCNTPVKYAASTSTPTGGTDASITTWFGTPFFGNTILANTSDARLVNGYNSANFDPTPFGSANSPLASGASFTDPKLATGFTTVTFRGAVAPGGADANWWKGWTRYN